MLHAHIDRATADCDGPMYDSYIVWLNDAEKAEHAEKDGVNDFYDLHFKERVLGNVVSFHAEGASVKVEPDGFIWHRPTEEGYERTEVEWCEDSCEDIYVHRDVYAEQMGY